MPLPLNINPCYSSVRKSFIISDLQDLNTNNQEGVMEHPVIRFEDNIELGGPVSTLKDRAAPTGTSTGWRNGPTQTS